MRPEDIETEGFDDQFRGKIINKIYDIKLSTEEDKSNKYIKNSILNLRIYLVVVGTLHKFINKTFNFH